MLLTNYAVRQRTAVFVFLVVMSLAGFSAYRTLPREGMPDLTIPYVFVTAPYRGVSPQEMESLVTIPLEKQLADLDNIKVMTSTSSEGLSSVQIEFTDREDMDSALQKVKDKITLARPDLPDDLDEPIAQSINFGADFPILMLAVSGQTDLQRLKFVAEDLKERIERIPGVREVELVGDREREIRVEVDPDRARAYGLSLGMIAHRIRQENRTVSAGNIEQRDSTIQIRLPGEFAIPFELESLVLANRGEQGIVYLSDLAVVRDTFKDITSISRINGESAVSLQVKKRSGANTIWIVDAIVALNEDYDFPPGIGAEITMDQAHYIRMMLQELVNNIITGFILVILVLMAFMGLRNATLVALAIPFSMLLSFAVMQLMGVSLNMIVLFSLVIAVGMLVDNAVVIVENIFRLHAEEGQTRAEAARLGAGQVAWPVTTSTLTTLAAFSPLLFWAGITGQFMGFMPRTLIVVLTCSLFVALVINPAICSLAIRKPSPRKQGRRHFFDAVADRYEHLLRAALRNRGLILAFSLMLFVLTAQMFGRWGGDRELFPDVEPSNATVTVRFPEGTPIEKTDAVLQRIESLVMGGPDIKYVLSTAGFTGGRGFDGSSGSHVGAVAIEFVDIADRSRSSFDSVDEIRERVGAIPGAEVKVERERAGPPTGAAIAIEVSGDDFSRLSALSAEIMRRIRGTAGLVDLVDDFETARPEMRFLIDRHRAALFGLDADTVGNFLRSGIFGHEAGQYRAGEDQFDITVRWPLAQRTGTDILARAFVPAPGGRMLPLSALGRMDYTEGLGSIRRKDQRRMITITAESTGERTPAAILADIQPLVASIALPEGYSISYGGDDEEMRESGAFLAGAFLVALGLIGVILVIQFNSVVYPFIIMFSVLMSIMGVLLGLLVTQMTFVVIMTGVGVISLAGVVVNNSIVLTDCFLQHRRDGLGVDEAIVQAGRQRLRPVLLTAITTILALVPMAAGFSFDFHSWPPSIMTDAETSAFWAPMAVAVIFGLAVASLLTLVQVPVMCSLAESIRLFFLRLFPGDRNGRASTPSP